MRTLIIGHKNPDTDSVVAAISYAELKEKIDPKNKYIPGIAGKVNNETKFVLKNFSVPTPKIIKDLSSYKGNIIIVDYNELSQAPKGIDEDKILEFIDHHRLGGMETASPVYVRIEPIGSTATIIAKIFEEKRIIPSKNIASLIISGIISDTLFLHEKTTTESDKIMLSKLNKICRIRNLESYASQMFEAKSDITGISASEIITEDYKEFHFGEKKIGIGVWETVKPESVLQEKEQLIKALKKLKNDTELNLVYFIVVDILGEKSEMIIIGKEEQKVAEKVFGGKTQGNILPLGKRISRKKEIVPPLEKFLV